MRFKKLKLKNIRSYEDAEVEFPEGSLLLEGDIGSGKTTLLLAVEYALFGLQPGQRGSALLRNNTEIGEVSLEFEVENKNIIIERRLKRNSRSISNEYSAITIGNKKTECSATELKTQIINLLGYPPEFIKRNNLLYRYTVYTPQEQMKHVILEDPQTRLNMLRHIFGVEKYRRIRENLAIFLNYIKEESKLIQGIISTLDNDKLALDASKTFLNSLGEKIFKKESDLNKQIVARKLIESEALELESKIKEKENLEKEVEKANILIITKKDTISSLNKEQSELSNHIEESRTEFNEFELNDVMKELGIKKQDLEKLNLKYHKIIAQITSLQKEGELNLSKKQRIFKIDICPTCLQDVPEAHKHNIMNETEKQLSEIRKTLETLEQEKTNLINYLEKQKIEISELEDKKTGLEILKTKISYLEKSRRKLKEIEKTKANLDKDLSLLLRHFESLKEQILKFFKYTNLVKIKKDELKNAFRDEKNLEIDLAELKKEKELTIREISNLEIQIKTKEQQKLKLLNMMELSDWLLNHFLSLITNIERNVLIKLRTEFSKLFNKWFHMLAGESFEVHLDENFTPIITQGEIEMDYAFLSGGERTSIALAYRLALNQTVSSVYTTIKTGNIVILDEPTDGFSEAQLDKMRDVFEELTVNQLIVVSHEQKMEDYVDNVIKLKKQGNISSLDHSDATINTQP